MPIYRFLSVLFFPLITIFLLFRVAKKKEDKTRLKERFGRSSQARPNGHVIWLHAVSVGETNSSLILVEELLKFSPNISILFTTTTLTSAAILAKKIPDFHGRVIHQFLPVDSFFCVRNFFNFWQPRAAIFVESEIWPNLIFEARKRGVSSFLVNARMSEKSWKKWLFARKFGFKIFDYFAAIFAQTTADQNRLSTLTNQEVFSYGNLKSQAQNLAVDEEKLVQLKAQIGQRKILLAASTHKGEEEILLSVFDELKKDFADLLLILVIRHPNRAEEVKNLLRGRNFSQRSQNQNIANSTEIYLVDTLGELGIFYSLTNFTFIGGSLLPIGGHNPFEAIKLGCAVIAGLQVFNFAEIYQNLQKNDACLLVKNSAELTASAKNLLQNENAAKALAEKAKKQIENSNNIAEKICRKLDQFLMIGV